MVIIGLIVIFYVLFMSFKRLAAGNGDNDAYRKEAQKERDMKMRMYQEMQNDEFNFGHNVEHKNTDIYENH